MGYNTYFRGSFKIEPPLLKPEYQRLAQTVEFWNSDSIKEHATKDVFGGGFAALLPADNEIKQSNPSCTFLLDPDEISANEESVKAYDDEDAFISIAAWLTANGHKLTGTVDWEGDSNDDSGTIYAEHVEGKNRVEFVKDERSNPGPSWEKKVSA